MWLIDTCPELILALTIVAVFLILVLLVKFSLILVAAGAILIVATKTPFFRRGIWNSWGTNNTAKRNARFYKAGFMILVIGIALFAANWFAGK